MVTSRSEYEDACPECGQFYGDPCINEDGDEITGFHKGRKGVSLPALIAREGKKGNSLGANPEANAPLTTKIYLTGHKKHFQQKKRQDRFNLYQNGITLGEYLALGGRRGDIKWDSRAANSGGAALITLWDHEGYQMEFVEDYSHWKFRRIPGQ